MGKRNYWKDCAAHENKINHVMFALIRDSGGGDLDSLKKTLYIYKLWQHYIKHYIRIKTAQWFNVIYHDLFIRYNKAINETVKILKAFKGTLVEAPFQGAELLTVATATTSYYIQPSMSPWEAAKNLTSPTKQNDADSKHWPQSRWHGAQAALMHDLLTLSCVYDYLYCSFLLTH